MKVDVQSYRKAIRRNSELERRWVPGPENVVLKRTWDRPEVGSHTQSPDHQIHLLFAAVQHQGWFVMHH